ncbi:MAG: hypothetical protein IT204_02380 [Fimbriimonadaceae bacterium]|nr:hypothetical protein [Fimbriimonadaceae bacterium]
MPRWCRMLLLGVVSPGLLGGCQGAAREAVAPISPAPRIVGAKLRTADRTTVVPLLDVPLQPDRNLVYSPALRAAWKRWSPGTTPRPTSRGWVAALERLPDPASWCPPQQLFTFTPRDGSAADWAAALAARFPGKATPQLPPGFQVYAYLEAAVNFQRPYQDLPQPLPFRTRGGVRAVQAFGVDPDAPGYDPALPRQAGRLWPADTPAEALPEFILDLDLASQPDQVILAVVSPGSTLAETVAQVLARCGPAVTLGPNDRLAVPTMLWKLSRRFPELGPAFGGLPGVQMDVEFRLDRAGAAVAAEALLPACTPHAYRVDRPFLVLLRRRGLSEPYLALWVADDELLTAAE